MCFAKRGARRWEVRRRALWAAAELIRQPTLVRQARAAGIEIIEVQRKATLS